jgi:hypothetical protein
MEIDKIKYTGRRINQKDKYEFRPSKYLPQIVLVGEQLL